MSTRQKVSQCINSGMELLLQGNIQAAIAALDEAEALDPSIAPWLWQRGLAYYFADRFDEGAKQFERDMAVNSRDTEESVWRFLCQARGHNLEFARSNLILPTEGDTRVPMYQALKLFQGSGTQEQVLEAVAKEPEGRKRQKAQFYGYYYIGLFHEACGNFEEAMKWIEKANSVKLNNDYMAGLCQMHELLRKNS
eukprot:TRINITY_DN5031_c0_g1_i1.p1 TRINITY_DN5031_c0_g1~~TRINITY_DN5031_c0_g1_i1.p1  ORF type:complete len:222 (+),score=21.75 TRINITY_DN5031_c0_g1_i1:82-666(+)